MSLLRSGTSDILREGRGGNKENLTLCQEKNAVNGVSPRPVTLQPKAIIALMPAGEGAGRSGLPALGARGRRGSILRVPRVVEPADHHLFPGLVAPADFTR